LNRGHRPARMPVGRSWSPDPQAGTPRDPGLRHVLIKYPVGESNPNPTGIRSPSADPLDGARCANIERSGLGGARDQSGHPWPIGARLSGSSDRRTNAARRCPRLSYQPKRKKPGVLVTPGFGKLDRTVGPSVTNADVAWAGYSPDNRQTARRISVRE